jgi:two-component system, response regulator PdtaR
METAAPHLVISDDDRDLRDSLGSLYLERGFKTSLASDGIEALEIAAQADVHLLLLDWHMPRMSGWEVYRQLRRQKLNTPCILMSGADATSVLNDVQNDEHFSFVPKPISPRRLIQVTWQALHLAYGWPIPSSVREPV